MIILSDELTSPRFAFTTDKYDMFSLCFHSVVPTNMRGQRHEVSRPHHTTHLIIIIITPHQVFLLTKHGVEAKNYENLGDAAKLKPLEVCVLQSKK